MSMTTLYTIVRFIARTNSIKDTNSQYFVRSTTLYTCCSVHNSSFLLSSTSCAWNCVKLSKNVRFIMRYALILCKFCCVNCIVCRCFANRLWEELRKDIIQRESAWEDKLFLTYTSILFNLVVNIVWIRQCWRQW